ncbi:hypothetical protein UR09_04140 [Candidatus Nitromaritima sp. SCGC AAA799-A02]|nr:hypothetical protein UR09_04140 [Candidatus Nitromaritima sp. SCGC AAA799-A02]KMP12182.1 hypothetical protein UZ36_01830 [Candidatus Nitromaritima sp. SCGC AAA799-C22]
MKSKIIFLAVFFWLLPLAQPGLFANNSIETAIVSSLEYLRDIPEINWIVVDNQNVIIGWKGLPALFNMINRGAAVKASNASGYPVHVWSVRHTQRKWKLGNTSYICKTLADNGKIKKSSCKR